MIDCTVVPACQTASTEGIDCGFKRVDGYLFPESTSKSDMDSIDKELAAAVRAGLTDVRKVGEDKFFFSCDKLCALPVAPASILLQPPRFELITASLISCLHIGRGSSVQLQMKMTPSGSPIKLFWLQVDLGGVSGAGGVHEALMFPGCVNIHPLSYVNGLADAVVKHGGHVFENSLVTDFSGKKVCIESGRHTFCSHTKTSGVVLLMRSPNAIDQSAVVGEVFLLSIQVTTEGGFTVEAPNVVLATHMPIYRNFAVISRQNPYRFYALGFSIPKVPLWRRLNLQLLLAFTACSHFAVTSSLLILVTCILG